MAAGAVTYKCLWLNVTQMMNPCVYTIQYTYIQTYVITLLICNNSSAGAYTQPGIIKLATPIVVRAALV